jgi:hypothetical protein
MEATSPEYPMSRQLCDQRPRIGLGSMAQPTHQPPLNFLPRQSMTGKRLTHVPQPAQESANVGIGDTTTAWGDSVAHERAPRARRGNLDAILMEFQPQGREAVN